MILLQLLRGSDPESDREVIEFTKENEYNLNIPRYVDTFEEEEPVDLKAVVAELKGLEADIADVDRRILKQCKELGIEAPVFTGKK